KLATKIPIAFTAIVVPDVTDAGADRGGAGIDGSTARGHWVFVPAIGHTFYAEHGEDLETKLASEVERVLDAAALEPPAWKRLLPPADTELVPIAVEVAVPGADAQASRRALIEAERDQRAEETLDAIGARLRPSLDGAPPLVGRAREEAALAALL